MTTKNKIINEGIPSRHFLIGLMSAISIFVFILKKFNIKMLRNSLNESIKYINKAPYMEVIIGIPAITMVIIVKIIIIIV